MELTTAQSKALERVIEFANNKNESVFILKGYAGTGKTTMVKEVIPALTKLGKNVELLAPTGRAAKILSEKTSYGARTIHSGIYSFQNMQFITHDDNDKEGSEVLKFIFAIKDDNKNPSERIFIIDESSMISSKTAHDEMLRFGTGVLINDIITYACIEKGGKVIFVGDPAQLPPVGDNRSAALEEEYFKERGISAVSVELTEVLRQSGESVILKNAMSIRDLLQEPVRNKLVFERKSGEFEDMERDEIIDSFYKNSPTPKIGDSIIIGYSNALVRDYNKRIRNLYFPDARHIKPGDILQIVKNIINLTLGIELYNGDFVRVVEVSDVIEKQSASVWQKNGKERVVITINFRDVVLESEDGSRTHCKIIDSLLDSENRDLTPLENTAMYVNLLMRNPKARKDKNLIMSDPYYNAVHAKYGYAITGHKSQGGEWKTVYVDYFGRKGLDNDSLRWVYTATTRASQRVYGNGIPNISPIDKITFKPIGKLSAIAKDAYSYAEIPDIDQLPEGATIAQKQKYLSVKSQLDEKGFYLKDVRFAQYNDKYTIETPSGSAVYNCYYNGSGCYTRFHPEAILPEHDEVLAILNNEDNMQFSVDYNPSNEALNLLYNKMLSLCDELGIKITNIVEDVPQHYVKYFLKTSGRFSLITFYFKGNYKINNAIPSSELGAGDSKLEQLIKELDR